MNLHIYPPLRCFHSLYDFIGAINTPTENFDKFLNNWLGHKSYLCTYRGRNGIYHILNYLKINFNIKRVLVPSYICKIVIPPIKMNNLEIVFVDNDLETLGMDGNSIHLKKNDVILWVNYFGLKTIPPKKLLNRNDIFIIEDNASYFQRPSSFADFTLYSFGKGKVVSSSEGGVVVVNKHKFKDISNQVKLNPPNIKIELIRLVNYFLWRLMTFRLIYIVGKKLKDKLRKSNDLNSLKTTIDGNELSMCAVSKRLTYKQLIQMQKLQERSKELAKIFMEKLKKFKQITVLIPKGYSNYFYVNLLVNQRDSLKSYLEKNNIFGSIPWEYLAEYILNKKTHKNASYILKHILQIKIDPTYMKRNDIEFITDNIKDWLSFKRME